MYVVDNAIKVPIHDATIPQLAQLDQQSYLHTTSCIQSTMSPRRHMILKDQPSKLKKLQRSKVYSALLAPIAILTCYRFLQEKKKRTPERLAPSRAFTACNCLQYTPHTTWSYSNGAGYTFNVVRPNVPCECPRYTPTLPAKKVRNIFRYEACLTLR